jgi:putative transposase
VYQLCKQKEQVEVLELNVQPDLVHLVVIIPPKYAVSEFMGYLKGKMALRLF